MKRLLVILAGAAIVCAVAYLVSVNEARVDFHFTPTLQVTQVHIVTLLVFAFIAGVLLVILGVLVQAGRRSLRNWSQNRRERLDNRIDAWEQRGEDLVWQGDPQHGRALLQRAWRRRPTSPHAVLALAASYADTGETERAREVLAEAARHQHTNPAVLAALAEAQRAAGDRAAMDTLERLRALHPRAPRAMRTLRDAYVEAGRWQEAAALEEELLHHCRNAAQAEEERQRLLVLRYQAAIHLPDPHARVQALEALTEARTVPLPVLASLGDALLAAGRGDEASVLWERALRQSPRTVFVERLAAMATESRHRDRLRGLLAKLRPDHVDVDHVRLLTARLYLADGNTDEAARVLDTLQHPASRHALVHRLWAEVHRRRGNLEQAVSAYGQANGSELAYTCTRCNRTAPDWTGFCPQCHSWDSYRSTVEIALPERA